MTAEAQPDTPIDEAHELDEVGARVLPAGYLVGGKYEIRRTLGMGGNGAVYEGEHTSVGHRVAIKVVHASLTGRQDIMSRFKHEARVCGSLRHANIGQVYDIGSLEDGSPYMVMELQEGRSLADIIDETKLPIPAILNLAQQLLSALGAAHHAGVVHRDVKPDNVMVVRDHGGDALVKLVDFGISKAVTRRHGDTRNTEEGIIIGSPDYMSPEQLRGEDVDLRTDIYSTGVLLYELITQRLPFEQEQLTELMVAVLRDPITPIRQHRPDCPPELERVVMKALSRERSARYASTAEMSRDLATARQSAQEAAASLAPLSQRPGPGDKALPTRRRRTIDARTLEFHRHRTLPTLQLPQAGRRRGVYGALGVAGVVLLGLLGLVALQPAPRVVVTHVAPTPTAAQDATKPGPPDAVPPAAPPEQVPPAVAATEGAPIEDRAAPAEAEPAEAAVAATELTAPPPGRPRPHAKRPRAVPETAAEAAPQAPAPSLQELERRAGAALIQGRTAEARSLYREIVRTTPRDASAWRGLAVTASRLGARTEAQRALSRYLTLRPDAPDADRIRAQVEKAR